MTDDLPFDYADAAPATGVGAPRKCRRHVAVPCTYECEGIHEAAVAYPRCARCGTHIDPAAGRRGRNNRKRGGAAELDVATRIGGRKVGPLGGPADILGRTYATQVKSHTGLPPTWLTTAPTIRFAVPSQTGYVWVCTSVLGHGHLAYAPARWRAIFDALEAESRTPRLVERWASQGSRAREWVVVRRRDEPGDPMNFVGAYVAWTMTDWLDRYGRDDEAAA